MHYCDFLVEAVLIGKAGNDKCVYFSSSKVLPFCSPLRVLTTILLLFAFRVVMFTDHLTIRKFWTGI